ncbi:MAG: cytochrome c [Candidatus Sumerlaeota bacterium]|nr:cytochrome c [Candidatus Sumerlaeota bacterium]
MKKKWIVIAVVGGAGVLGVAGFLGFIFSGIYNVAATAPHSGFVEWVLSTTSDNSVRVRAKKIKAPADLASADRLDGGFRHYHVMCLTCHGAPGVPRSAIGNGLNPLPPDLIESAKEQSPAEIFWIVKSGIKMTGMPAFGPNRDEDRLWDIVAFVMQFPKMTPAQYKEMVKKTGVTPTPEESD